MFDSPTYSTRFLFFFFFFISFYTFPFESTVNHVVTHNMSPMNVFLLLLGLSGLDMLSSLPYKKNPFAGYKLFASVDSTDSYSAASNAFLSNLHQDLLSPVKVVGDVLVSEQPKLNVVFGFNRLRFVCRV